MTLTAIKHLGCDLDGFDLEKACRNAVDVAVDYFFGEYCQTGEWAVERRYSSDNENLRWLSVFRNGVFLAQLTENSDVVDRLANWVQPWLPYDGIRDMH